MLNSVNLHHGDCLEILPKLISEGIKVDMILTDLPYGETANTWDKIIDISKLWNYYFEISHSTTPILLFNTEPFGTLLRMSNIKNYKYDLIWLKNISTNFHHAKRMPLRKSENISVFYKKQPIYNPQMSTGHVPTSSTKGSSNGKTYHGKSKRDYKGGSTERYPNNILEYKSVSQYSRKHPSEKPTDLLEYLIKTYTHEGMVVLDSTMGSGSTGVACVNTNRKFIGIEKDLKYFEIAKERILKGEN